MRLSQQTNIRSSTYTLEGGQNVVNTTNGMHIQWVCTGPRPASPWKPEDRLADMPSCHSLRTRQQDSPTHIGFCYNVGITVSSAIDMLTHSLSGGRLSRATPYSFMCSKFKGAEKLICVGSSTTWSVGSPVAWCSKNAPSTATSVGKLLPSAQLGLTRWN